MGGGLGSCVGCADFFFFKQKTAYEIGLGIPADRSSDLHNSNFFSDKLVLTPVTPASSAPVLQTPKATSSTLYFDSLTVNAGNGGFLHCIQMDTSVNAANQVVSVGADIAFDADPKFFACLVRFESSSVPTTLPTAYDVYPLDGRHDGGYYTVKDCVTIDVLPRTPG